MEINSYDQSGRFELTGELGLDKKYFRSINPFFFNFYKRTSDGSEIAEPLPGVTIEWSEKTRQPVVSVDNPQINPDGQLFIQVYGDQMVEV